VGSLDALVETDRAQSLDAARRPQNPGRWGAPPRSGEVLLGRYRLLECLGTGGFGVVWRARDELLRREVALKRVPLAPDRDGERASREALAAARLAHPGIVALYEACTVEDAFYLISELVHGETLAELLAGRTLGDEEVLGIGVALADALAHAHSRGVIHRDVKPQNVLVPRRTGGGAATARESVGVAKLTDFGGARLAGEDLATRTGDVLGTLAYMAPEQSEGDEVGEEADLYSLALVLYEALSGVNPVRGSTPAATARRIGRRIPPLEHARGDLPRALTRALDSALASAPSDRGTLMELRVALEDTLERWLEPALRWRRLRGTEISPEVSTLSARGAARQCAPAWVPRTPRRGEVPEVLPPIEGPEAPPVIEAPGVVPADAPAEVLPADAAAEAPPVIEAPGVVPADAPAEALPADPAAEALATGAPLEVLPAPAARDAVPAIRAPAALADRFPPSSERERTSSRASTPKATRRRLWLGCALAAIVWLAFSGRPGVALLAFAAACPLAPLFVIRARADRRGLPGTSAPARTAGLWWLVALLAPALGLAGLAGAYPAIAGQARQWRRRMALAALGYWWLTLAKPLADFGFAPSRLWLGELAGTPARAVWEGSLGSTAGHVIGPMVSLSVFSAAGVWALGALVLPWVVRGRRAPLDLLAAVTWSAAIAATCALVSGNSTHLHASPRGAVLGAIVGAVLAVGARALRGPV
jgi:hypothetical protein